jgi:hypothetical protein
MPPSIGGVEQIVEKGQTRAIAACVAQLNSPSFIAAPTAKVSFKELLQRLNTLLDEQVCVCVREIERETELERSR